MCGYVAARCGGVSLGESSVSYSAITDERAPRMQTFSRACTPSDHRAPLNELAKLNRLERLLQERLHDQI